MSRTVTVLIPTRNRADYLGAALASVNAAGEEARRRFGSTTTALVVDDVSTDEGATRQVAEKWGARYHLIQEHDGRHDPGIPIVAGVGLLDSDYFQLLGDDDVLLPHALSTCLGFVADGADAVSTSSWVTDADLRPVREVLLPQPDLGDIAHGHSTICDGSVMRTDAVQGFHLDVANKKVMLMPLWAHLLLEGTTFEVTPYPTWLYRRHDANISSSISDEDQAIRARVVSEIQADVIARLGHLPPSPREAALEERRAMAQARRDQAARDAAARDAGTTAPGPQSPTLVTRARRRLSRAIAP
jgi:glycosyltransferase involved in cell wall biosynthesis